MEENKHMYKTPVAKGRLIFFWIVTGLVGLETAVGSIWDLCQIPFVTKVMTELGYPSYFLVFMGLWKAPGAVVLLLPRLPRLKEWVYAGLVFTYTGATFSHLAVEGSIHWDPIIFTVLTLVSWALRPASRKL